MPGRQEGDPDIEGVGLVFRVCGLGRSWELGVRV